MRLALALALLSGCARPPAQEPSAVSAVCEDVAGIDRTCVDDTDCVTRMHRADCCGSVVWIGLRSDEAARFDAAEADCAAQASCECLAQETTAETGEPAPTSANVSCARGRCRAWVSARP
jgi:hypothetical protein